MSEPAPDSFISAEAGHAYWNSIDADVNGMLGGSRAFLAELGIGCNAGLRSLNRVLEGGAGIGRVTEGLLLPLATTVDVVEPIAKFTEALRGKKGVGKIFNVGLEEFGGEDEHGEALGSYDLFWNQWCLGHLKDDELVHYYLSRSKAWLSDDQSLIVVKENIAEKGKDELDEVDSSVTRQESKYQQIFKKAGLRIIKTELQSGLPKDLFAVRMYALRPE
uniref:Alpha N-terminal protein methyltransferase 1 n=1 Tax=Bionectria ochroleuca TaxID=29856 RepID=A0A8H7K2F8_BIOOC